jgi:hypothetical protein
MEDSREYASKADEGKPAARIGAFVQRRNPLPDDPPENDIATAAAHRSKPLHDVLQKSNEASESPIDQHQRLEWAAALRSYRNTKLLLSSLVEVTPRGTLTLVS